jgi:ribosomal protein S19E (S16A)
VIEKFSVVSQCAFRLAANTYVIYKQTNNAEKILYIYFVRKTGHTGLHFDEEQQEQLVKLEKLPNQKAWFYINEAANATTFYTRLAMLIGAVEGIAGEKTIKGRKKTNFEVSKKILGEELYKKMYEQGKGIRHQLLHGNVNTEEIFDGLNDELYTKIRIYLKTEYNVELYEDVVHPQRNFHDNFEYAGMFMKFVNEPVLDLKIIEDAVDDDKPQHHLKQKEIFTYLGETPKSY